MWIDAFASTSASTWSVGFHAFLNLLGSLTDRYYKQKVCASRLGCRKALQICMLGAESSNLLVRKRRRIRGVDVSSIDPCGRRGGLCPIRIWLRIGKSALAAV
jgi:hypothetical protein